MFFAREMGQQVDEIEAIDSFPWLAFVHLIVGPKNQPITLDGHETDKGTAA